MGRIATQMLIRQVESNEILRPRKVYLDAELVIRGSTAAPKAVQRASASKVGADRHGARRAHHA
jgi:hypothetical protein